MARWFVEYATLKVTIGRADDRTVLPQGGVAETNVTVFGTAVGTGVGVPMGLGEVGVEDPPPHPTLNMAMIATTTKAVTTTRFRVDFTE
jgi:hypothetical protein